ncbi:MAG: F0F1 ATP synthase subunit delta [Pseudomonadota bacterium]
MAEKTTLARPYAEAIFELATADGNLDSWTEKLQLISEVTSLDEVIAIVKNPEIKLDDCIAIISELCSDKLDEQSINLLRLAGENGKLELFPEVTQEFENLKAQAQGTMEAEVISAFAVNAAQKKLITESLEKRFNKQVSITTKVDKSLIGGIVIRAGDLVIDGSISNQLQKITHTLMS